MKGKLERLQKRESNLVSRGYKAVDEGRDKKADRLLKRAAKVENRVIRNTDKQMMSPKKGGLKDKLNAATERMNAGRQAKLSAKSDIAYNQGNIKKGAKLEMRSKKVALRSEKRQTVSDAKKAMKIGKTIGQAVPKLMMKSTSTPMNRPDTGELDYKDTPRLGNKLTRIGNVNSYKKQ
jgi:hypothetical protein